MKESRQPSAFFTVLRDIVIVDVFIFVFAGIFTWFRMGLSLPSWGYVLVWVGGMVSMLGICFLGGRSGENYQARNLGKRGLASSYSYSPHRITDSEPMSEDYKVVIVLVSAGALAAFVGFVLSPYF